MKWTKPSLGTIEYFERIAPGPPIEARVMFGMPSRFLNGHMLVTVFGNSLMLHLSESDRAECIEAGARPFAPQGRSGAEDVEIVPGLFEDRTVKEWIARGMRYLGGLPPKLAKPAKVKATDGGAVKGGAVSKKAAVKGGAVAKKRAAKKVVAKVAKKKSRAAAKPKTKRVVAKLSTAKAKPVTAKRSVKKSGGTKRVGSKPPARKTGRR